MKLVLQRVSKASVEVDGKIVGDINKGLVALLGVEQGDTEEDAAFLAQKTVDLRIFADENGKMNKSLLDAGGSVLLISQFTLMADWRQGRRPGFTRAAAPAEADKMYRRFGELLSERNAPVQHGVFGAHMNLSLVNDGPVTLILENQFAGQMRGAGV